MSILVPSQDRSYGWWSDRSSHDEAEDLRGVLAGTELSKVYAVTAAFSRVAEENAALRELTRRRGVEQAIQCDLGREEAESVEMRLLAGRGTDLQSCLDRWAREEVPEIGAGAWLEKLLAAGAPTEKLVRSAATAIRAAEAESLEKVRRVQRRLEAVAKEQQQLERAAQAAQPRRLASIELGRALRLVEALAHDLALCDEPGFAQLARDRAADLTQGLPRWRAHVASL